MRLTLLFSIVLLFWRATTLAFHKIIRNDDFCGKKCWILNMIDHLRYGDQIEDTQSTTIDWEIRPSAEAGIDPFSSRIAC